MGHGETPSIPNRPRPRSARRGSAGNIPFDPIHARMAASAVGLTLEIPLVAHRAIATRAARMERRGGGRNGRGLDYGRGGMKIEAAKLGTDSAESRGTR